MVSFVGRTGLNQWIMAPGAATCVGIANVSAVLPFVRLVVGLPGWFPSIDLVYDLLLRCREGLVGSVINLLPKVRYFFGGQLLRPYLPFSALHSKSLRVDGVWLVSSCSSLHRSPATGLQCVPASYERMGSRWPTRASYSNQCDVTSMHT